MRVTTTTRYVCMCVCVTTEYRGIQLGAYREIVQLTENISGKLPQVMYWRISTVYCLMTTQETAYKTAKTIYLNNYNKHLIMISHGVYIGSDFIPPNYPSNALLHLAHMGISHKDIVTHSGRGMMILNIEGAATTDYTLHRLPSREPLHCNMIFTRHMKKDTVIAGLLTLQVCLEYSRWESEFWVL